MMFETVPPDLGFAEDLPKASQGYVRWRMALATKSSLLEAAMTHHVAYTYKKNHRHTNTYKHLYAWMDHTRAPPETWKQANQTLQISCRPIVDHSWVTSASEPPFHPGGLDSTSEFNETISATKLRKHMGKHYAVFLVHSWIKHLCFSNIPTFHCWGPMGHLLGPYGHKHLHLHIFQTFGAQARAGGTAWISENHWILRSKFVCAKKNPKFS